MNTPAIHQAIRLQRQPVEMAWLCFPDSDLPEGMNDLLRISSSKEQLLEFSEKNGFDPKELSLALLEFIEKVMLNEKNSNEKILGINKFSSSQLRNYHYEMLMMIYNSDENKRPDSENLSTLITSAYENLKKHEEEQDVISFSEYRKPAKSHNQHTRQPESQISNSKTAIALISVITISTLVAMSGKFYGTSIVKQEESTPAIEENIVSESLSDSLQLMSVSSIQKVPQTVNQSPIVATNTSLQSLLKDLEVAYEKGDVDTIKLILANAPEIKSQTEKQLNDKLETIFEITSERKMVLFDFEWTDISGTLQGKGSFISRYQLVGEEKWLTREGTALVTAKNINNKLKVTRLTLQNKQID